MGNVDGESRRSSCTAFGMTLYSTVLHQAELPCLESWRRWPACMEVGVCLVVGWMDKGETRR